MKANSVWQIMKLTLLWLSLACVLMGQSEDSTTSIETSSFNISLIQNNAPSSTLFSCEIKVEKTQISISGSGYSEPIQLLNWKNDYTKSTKFSDHIVSIEDEKLATDFLMIAKYFKLCHEGMDMRCVSGGTITKIMCVASPNAPVQEARYIALDQSKRRCRLMEDICRDVQMLVVNDVLNDDVVRKKSLEALQIRVGKLASDIGDYTKAFSLLEDACHKGLLADWAKISALVAFRPDQPPLEKRTRLVQTAHDVVTSSCSKFGLQHILGKDFADDSALILKIGEVRRCRGAFSFPNNNDWGFDDVGMSLGFVYPPTQPALRVGILDLGIERLLLDFLLQGAADTPNAYDRFSLSVSGREWGLVERWSFKKDPIPDGTKGRLKYLSAKSGLLEHLLAGKIPENIVFLDVNAIVIEDDNWKAARLDYYLGKEMMIMPLFINDRAWLPNRPWTESAYRNTGEVIENSDYFRSHDDVMKHNAEQGAIELPVTSPDP